LAAIDPPRGVKIELQRAGGAVELRGFVEGWGPKGSFPTACFWKCDAEPKLDRVERPLAPARVLALLAALRLAPADTQAGFPVTLQVTADGDHACLPRPGSMSPPPPPGHEAPADQPLAPAYTFPAKARLSAASGASIAGFPVEVMVRPRRECSTCATISLSGTAPLELQELLDVPDRRGIVARVLFALELGIREQGRVSTEAALKLSYLDRRNGERVQAYDLKSSH
jgi:hypothetical protein